MKEFNELIGFLRQDLAISSESIGLVLNHHSPNTTQLPIILHQYGLITISQLELIFDWLERFNFNNSDRVMVCYPGILS